jgi:hypothetical protein
MLWLIAAIIVVVIAFNLLDPAPHPVWQPGKMRRK